MSDKGTSGKKEGEEEVTQGIVVNTKEMKEGEVSFYSRDVFNVVLFSSNIRHLFRVYGEKHQNLRPEQKARIRIIAPLGP
jgi:hypothetical protein